VIEGNKKGQPNRAALFWSLAVQSQSLSRDSGFFVSKESEKGAKKV
jgi:hypothetical protein